MNGNNLSNLLSERSEQELRFFKQFFTVFGFSFSFLLALVGLKYQNSDDALFHEHRVIMVLLIIDVCIGTIALAIVTLPTFRNSSLFLFEIVCLIYEVFACDLLLLILYIYIMCIWSCIYTLWRIPQNFQFLSRNSKINKARTFSNTQ